MNRRDGSRLVALVLTVLSLGVTPATEATASVTGEPDPRASGLAELRARSQEPVVTRFVNGFPQVVRAKVRIPGTDPVQRAEAYLAELSGLYGQDSSRTDLMPVRRVDVPSDAGASDDLHGVVVQQFVDGVPVFGGTMTVLMDDVDIVGSVGTLLTDNPAAGGEPELSADEAGGIASNHRRAGTDCRDAADCFEPVSSQLVVYEHEEFSYPGDPARFSLNLAWLVVVDRADPHVVIVDAKYGRVLTTYPLHGDGFDLQLRDANNQLTPKCDDPTDRGTLIGTEGGVFASAKNVNDAQAALGEAKKAHGFYKTLGRDSYDGKGSRIDVTVNHPTEGTATWSSCAVMTFNPGAVKRDLVGHELTHGVVQHTAALPYKSSSGAMNESFADIMGSLLEFANEGDPDDPADWLIAEETSGGAFRSLADPRDYNDPDRLTDYQNRPVTEEGDWGGVHTNSGIHNKAGYLMAEGGTFNGVQVKPFHLGVDQLGTLMLHTMILMPNTLPSAGNAYIAAADTAMALVNYWSNDPNSEFEHEDTCTVRNAYAATEIIPVGWADADCDGVLDDGDPDTDGDSAPDATDNCPGLSNPSQLNQDGDLHGDACDTDVDGDKVPNDDDNCPSMSNGAQSDKDGNGVGDACQDTDGDTILDEYDNCPKHANYSQANADGSPMGDACDLDDDNDEVDDVDDNCPTTANADQTDSDSGGLGDACDEWPHNPINDLVLPLDERMRNKVDLQANKTELIHIDACGGRCAGSWLDPGTRVRFSMKGLPKGSTMTVMTAEGTQLASKVVKRTDKATVASWSAGGTGDYTVAMTVGSAAKPKPYTLTYSAALKTA